MVDVCGQRSTGSRRCLAGTPGFRRFSGEPRRDEPAPPPEQIGPSVGVCREPAPLLKGGSRGMPSGPSGCSRRRRRRPHRPPCVKPAQFCKTPPGNRDPFTSIIAIRLFAYRPRYVNRDPNLDRDS
jgi:hypothetical protein